MGSRFDSFLVSFRETDLWIGVDRASVRPGMLSEMRTAALRKIRKLRAELEAWELGHAGFFESFDPVPEVSNAEDAPESVRIMIAATSAAGVGPMASVAGAFARLVGEQLKRDFGPHELVVENGGDLWMSFECPLDIAVFAGRSPLSGRIGIRLPSRLSPCGVCTSSGTVGPSLSFGKADAAMVLCGDAALADAWATAAGNMVATARDIERALATTAGAPGVLSVIIVKDDQMGIQGILPLQVYNA